MLPKTVIGGDELFLKSPQKGARMARKHVKKRVNGKHLLKMAKGKMAWKPPTTVYTWVGWLLPAKKKAK